jgi:hypothetical protein
MRFLTVEEARSRCGEMVRLDAQGLPLRPDREALYARAPVPGIPELTAFCRHLEHALQPRDACLLWVTEWGIWTSSEHLHLYYRLRQSYGDQRLLDEAPAHLFLDYEAADLVSFLAVGIVCGWDMHLIPFVGYARAFVSHDEYVQFAADEGNPDIVHEFASQVGGAEIRSGAPSA